MKEKSQDSRNSEILKEINGVIEVLDQLFWNSYPLMQLGHTNEEIRLIHKMYESVVDGVPSKVWPDNSSHYWYRGVSFESEVGVFSISSSVIPDHVVSGIIDFKTQLEKNLQNCIFPKIFLLNKSQGENPTLDDVAWRIFRGGIYRKQSKIAETFGSIPVVGTILNANKIEYFYLDDAQKEIIVHFIDRKDYVLLRNITPKDSRYHVWGVRDNFDKKKLADTVRERKAETVLRAIPKGV
jgi:hypothetical protein